MSDAFILENLYRRQFDAKHQAPSNHTLTTSTTTTPSSTKTTSTPSATKPLGNTTSITANPNHTHP